MVDDGLIIRNAVPEDAPQVVRFLQAIFAETEAQKSAYFDEGFWLWSNFTPGFESIVALAEDKGEIAGCFHLVSRPMNFYGKLRRMVSLQDLAVLPKYRRNKLFLRLSNHATDQLPELGWDITFSLPNQRSYPGFIKHLNYSHVATVPVYVRPLQPGQLLANKLPGGVFWRSLGKLGMKIFDTIFPGKTSSSITIQPIDRFTPEVNAVSTAFVVQAGIGCTRDADFLNWRFIENPAVTYQAWGAWQNDKLVGYSVTRKAHLFGSEALVIMDMIGESDILRYVIHHALQNAEGCALAVTMGLHPSFKSLWRDGFIRVPDRANPRPLNFIVRQHTARVTDAVLDAQNWCLTLADWDVL